MFKEDREMSTKKQVEKARKDPVKSQAPMKPISGSSKHIFLHALNLLVAQEQAQVKQLCCMYRL